jgi:germination protein YpeB
MRGHRKLGRRSLVRIISFTVALVAALAASSISAYALAHSYRTTMEYTYQRALNQLYEYVSKLSTTLDKGQYAATEKQLQGLSTKLWQDAGYAKTAIEQLPIEVSEISSTSKFLSQVGNFCIALSNRVSEGDLITDKDLETLDRLANYADSLSDRLAEMISDLESGRLKLGEVRKSYFNKSKKQQTVGVDSGFKKIEESFADYPTMIYDGPFSDHILKQQPRLTQNKGKISHDKALQIAKETTGVKNLEKSGETEGNLPTYDFSSDTARVSVTKSGGYLDYYLNSRPVGEPKISYQQAIKRAEKVLADFGLAGFKYRYYAFNNGVLTVNFAATQNGVVLYPDLIKVGIALDDGSLVSYDAKGYIMNHHLRSLPKIKISESDARRNLSKRLTVKSHSLAVIPTEGLSERLCHEFYCTGEKDERILVYVNVETGMEEQILIIIEDETGVLAI